MQSRDAIRAIKERLNITDIVRRYVDLKRNGPRWVAPCPFHQETKPSFSVNEEQGLFYWRRPTSPRPSKARRPRNAGPTYSGGA